MTEIVDRPANQTPTRSPDELEPIETASRDEISALQLARLKWSLQHAYDNVAHYRNAFDGAGVHPGDLNGSGGPGVLPVHHQGGPTSELSVRHVRRTAV